MKVRQNASEAQYQTKMEDRDTEEPGKYGASNTSTELKAQKNSACSAHL